LGYTWYSKIYYFSHFWQFKSPKITSFLNFEFWIFDKLSATIQNAAWTSSFFLYGWLLDPKLNVIAALVGLGHFLASWQVWLFISKMTTCTSLTANKLGWDTSTCLHRAIISFAFVYFTMPFLKRHFSFNTNISTGTNYIPLCILRMLASSIQWFWHYCRVLLPGTLSKDLRKSKISGAQVSGS